MSTAKKGPASAPTLPSHGSTKPTKDMDMNKPDTTTEHDRTATVEDFASMDFQPWEGDPKHFPLTVDEWQRKTHLLLVVSEFSHRLMHKSKAEIMSIVDGWSEEEGQLAMRSFIDATDFLKALTAMTSAAETRILVAGCTLEEEEAKQ